MVYKHIKESVVLTKDILRGVNQTVWGGAEGAKKVSTSIKAGIAGTDTIVGISHAIEDFTCKDYICFSLDCIGSTSSAAGIVLGNIPATKKLTTVTTAITITCRGVRYICKRYGLAWSCAIAYSGAKAGSKYARKGTRYLITKIC